MGSGNRGPCLSQEGGLAGRGLGEGQCIFFPDLHSAKRVLTCAWRTGCIRRELRLWRHNGLDDQGAQRGPGSRRAAGPSIEANYSPPRPGRVLWGVLVKVKQQPPAHLPSPHPANLVMGQDRSQAARRSGQPTVQQFINGVGLLGRTPPAAFLPSRKTCH